MTEPGLADARGEMAGPRVSIRVDGRALQVPEGRTLGAALLDRGIRVLRHSPSGAEGRGLFCAMGVCFECLVTVDGSPARRAGSRRVFGFQSPFDVKPVGIGV